ncbi:MAG: MobV family relaxase, partial [Huintestinicola sp.]
MAHVEKYTAAATGHMLAHYDRTHSSSTSLIDESRTALNHNLAGIDQPLPQLDFLHKRLGEIKVMKRADVNVMCDWIVTAPKELTPEELPLFFNETYKFLNERYGKENVISAYVHMDETTPHIHYAFVPVVIDKKKGIPKLSAKERITRKDLNTFHPDLTKHMAAVFGRNIGIQNDATALGNQTIKQLRKKSANLEEFMVTPVPVTELPQIVKTIIKDDKVIISRSELNRVNQAAEEATIIMANAEAVNKQLAEKSEKTDNNYKKSEEYIFKAENQALSIVSDAEKKAAEISQEIADDKAHWEETKAEIKSSIDNHLATIEQRERQLSEREAAAEQQEQENRKAAEQNARDAEYTKGWWHTCKRREEELDKRAEDQCGYYLKKIDNMTSYIEKLRSSGKELSLDNIKLHNELDR